MDETHVVTCFLRHDGEVLLLRRSDEVGSYAGRWGTVAGHTEGDPDAAARQEIAEETGLADAVTFVRKGEPFAVEDADLDRRWIVHPYLFDCARRDLALNWEATEATWTSPTEILRRDTVPDLWTSYEHVAPSVQTVAQDDTHGSAYLSVRALEVLRDEAGRLYQGHTPVDHPADRLRTLARHLLDTHPSMAALRNRLHRAMHSAAPGFRPEVVEREAHGAIQEAVYADADASQRAADLIGGRTVLTLSRSGTVLGALRAAYPGPRVIVAESRPVCEGISVAETLARAGLDVTLITDAAVPFTLAQINIDLVLIGADTILPNGAVVNKTGSYMAALAAQRANIPFYAAASVDKISLDTTPHLEDGPPDAVYDGDAPLTVCNPTFDCTPADLITGYVTERGILHPGDLSEVVEELRAHTTWLHAAG